MPERQPERHPAPNKDHYLVSANGRLGQPPQSAVGEVERILDLAMQQAPQNGLLIHFHGGLVSRDYALKDIVARLTPRYVQAAAYPLFFVWESGFREAIVNNKKDLVKDPAFRALVKKVSEWVLKKVSMSGKVSFKGAGGQSIEDEEQFRREYERWSDGARELPPVEDSDIAGDAGATTRAAAGVPDLDDLSSEIETQLDDDPGFKKAMTEALHSAGAAPATQLSAEALDEMLPSEDQAEEGEDGTQAKDQFKTRGVITWTAVAFFVAKIVIAVVKRFRSGRDHGVYCTIVEEVLRSAYGALIGAVAWNAMKKDTQDSLADGIDTCGWLVLRKLKALEDAGQRFEKITLVGHSTGAITICNFLDVAKTLKLTTPVQVVFLVPAVTCQRFAEAINAHEASHLRHFRMFAMRDDRETADAMLKPVYTRSLLYFVSGLLEGQLNDGAWKGIVDMPLLGMERSFTAEAFRDDAQVQTVRAFLDAQPNRMVWSRAADAGDGLNSDAQRHGDFDNDEPTLASLLAIVRGKP